MSDYYDLGAYSRAITTSSPEAQKWFDRGLNWAYAFNHEEAVKCYEKALEADPDCAMAHWGIAYAVGPNYNMPWKLFDRASLKRAIETARAETAKAEALVGGVTPFEAAVIGALRHRYPADEPVEDFTVWDDSAADAMREVHSRFPADLDVITLYAEALMNRTPWNMWDLEKAEPTEGADTIQVEETIQAAFRNLPGAMEHPGLLHLYVHLMEMSPTPERALNAGDALRELVPDAGHLIHMPTHIDVLCGHYQTVVEGNHKAIVADRKFLEREGAMNFYSAYRIHNYHFKIYGAMFLGRFAPAIDAAEELIATIPEELLRQESPPMAHFLEGYIPMKQHVLVRFGKWDEILGQPLPEDPELYCVTTAMMRYARGVAKAATGDIEGAEAEQAAFRKAVKTVPDKRQVHNNTCIDLLAIADQMLSGEIEYRRGNYDAAYAHLRKSVELDDTLPYDEPWGWMQPTRHALGALLLEQGHAEEAEAVYRSDLGLDGKLRRACQHPDNVWSLHGLHECLVRRGERVESTLIKQRLDIAGARADVPIKASCFCRMQHAA
jgi:tetratricopeptide (TPR) repeat protein